MFPNLKKILNWFYFSLQPSGSNAISPKSLFFFLFQRQFLKINETLLPLIRRWQRAFVLTIKPTATGFFRKLLTIPSLPAPSASLFLPHLLTCSHPYACHFSLFSPNLVLSPRRRIFFSFATCKKTQTERISFAKFSLFLYSRHPISMSCAADGISFSCFKTAGTVWGIPVHCVYSQDVTHT